MSGVPPRGLVVWLTGLPGAGKSTLARLLEQGLAEEYPVEVIDADQFRRDRASDLGYTRSDRERNAVRMATTAAETASTGKVVVVAAIAPYESARRRARMIVEAQCSFLEVFVHAPIAVCMRRDPKGLYRRALAGEIDNFTGISDPYEPPRHPDLTVGTHDRDRGAAASLILGLATAALQQLAAA